MFNIEEKPFKLHKKNVEEILESFISAIFTSSNLIINKNLINTYGYGPLSCLIEVILDNVIENMAKDWKDGASSYFKYKFIDNVIRTTDLHKLIKTEDEQEK